MKLFFVALTIFFTSITLSADINSNVTGDQVVGLGQTLTVDNATVDGKITVNGGSLFLKNSAVVTGDVYVSNGGNVDGRTLSTIEGKLSMVKAGKLVTNNFTVAGIVKFKEGTQVSSTTTNYKKSVFITQVPNVSISNSTFTRGLRVTKAADATITSSVFGGKLLVDKSKRVLSISNSSRNLVLIRSEEFAVAQQCNVNGSSFVSYNNLMLIDSSSFNKLDAVKNVDTNILNNSIKRTLKIIPGSGDCVEEGNTYSRLEGGC